MSNIEIDPRIKIVAIADGEVHIVFEWTQQDLEQFARYWLAMEEGKVGPGGVVAAMRIKSAEAVDHLIEKLIEAGQEAWG